MKKPKLLHHYIILQ